jgi:hypothetical protein
MRTLRVALLATGASASVLIFAGLAHAMSVHVQRHVAVRQNVHITLHAHKLPEHGYYYAVLVLKPYKKYTATSPPPCSPSSNMYGADYGYPRPDGEVKLTLTPSPPRTEGPTKQWCPGGSYEGGVYAVPHPPPCESKYPCTRSEPYKIPQCFTGSNGGLLCGIVVPRGWKYPERLPKPLATGTRILGRFTVKFP